jgi:hypothetical protein
MIRRCSIAVASALMFAAPAHAADPLSYSYWQAAYLNSEVEITSGPASAQDEVEGYRGAVSIGLARYVFFTGDTDQRRYSNARDAFSSAGLGLHTVNPTWQFFGAATYERLDHDDNSTSANDDTTEGYGVEAGVRINVPNVALHATYRYLDLGKDDTTEITGAVYGAGLALQLSPWWALVGDYRLREHNFEDPAGDVDVEYTEWTVGFRRYIATDADRRKRKGGILFPEEAPGGAAE